MSPNNNPGPVLTVTAILNCKALPTLSVGIFILFLSKSLL
jgi:hypothetical protein